MRNNIGDKTDARIASNMLLFLLLLLLLLRRIMCGASVTQRAFASQQIVRVSDFRIKRFVFWDSRAQFPGLNIG
jgi:hypothetical protein